MRDLIRELAEHATVIVSTHILQEVEAVCDRVLILRSGRLGLDRTLAQLRRDGRLLVTLDRPPASAGPLLARLTGVQGWSLVDGSGPRQRYALETTDADAAAPLVARAVAEAGWPLFALHGEGRDLEALFREVNSIPPDPPLRKGGAEATAGTRMQEAAHV
jgi:ABC-2 type transport system ATP-binding protein